MTIFKSIIPTTYYPMQMVRAVGKMFSDLIEISDKFIDDMLESAGW